MNALFIPFLTAVGLLKVDSASFLLATMMTISVGIEVLFILAITAGFREAKDSIRGAFGDGYWREILFFAAAVLVSGIVGMGLALSNFTVANKIHLSLLLSAAWWVSWTLIMAVCGRAWFLRVIITEFTGDLTGMQLGILFFFLTAASIFINLTFLF